MRRNIIETVMGGVVLLVAIAFVVFAFRSASLSNAGSNGYQVTVEFNDASGLNAGTDVRMAGVKIGTVVAQQLNPDTYFAEVTLGISESVRLPSDSSARIIPDGLLGGNYVSLEPGGDEEYIAHGGKILYAQGSVNVVDLLGRFIFSAAEQGSGANKNKKDDAGGFEMEPGANQ
ncbi:MAG: outer membrane lipid asymmetry maintenance protein MlaD [Kiloniellaceae bacterium]|nr:outer membrane lipid asymmetry maintenance protein MlaD [Kiloniellaceae bacterium]